MLPGCALLLLLAVLPASAQATWPGSNGRLVLTRQNPLPSTSWDIWAMNPDGTGTSRLTNTASENELEAAVSPNGAKVVFKRTGIFERQGIWTTGFVDRSQVRVTPGLWNGARFTADGKRLVAGASQDVYRFDLDGSNQVNLTNAAAETDSPQFSQADVAADGRIVVRYFKPGCPGVVRIVVMNADGSGRRQLYADTDPRIFVDEHPRWSPDGMSVLVTRRHQEPDGPCSARGVYAAIVMISTVTGAQVELGRGHSAIFSPDGTKIAFHGTERLPSGEERTGIWVRNLDGTGLAFVTASGILLDWAPEMTICNGAPATIVGTEGPDTLTGTAEADVIHGLGGDDVIDGADADDVICGGAGDDTLNGTSGLDELYGAEGNDMLNGGNDDDTLFGGPGDDGLGGDAGADLLEGGAGEDTLSGLAGADEIDGGEGNDLLFGGTEVDVILGGAGSDILDGGDADDDLRGEDDGDAVFGEGGDDTIAGGAGDDQLDAGEDGATIDGGDGHDELKGGPANDALIGGQGDDSLGGEAGADLLSGGAGKDTLRGLAGADEINGGEGNDVAYGGPEVDALFGAAGSDLLYGGDGDDDLRGEEDGDAVFGEAGRDTIAGGAGDDQLDAGEDGATVKGEAGDDALAGGEDWDSLSGGEGNDTLRGAGNPDGLPDLLFGGDGADDLQGGAGDDRLDGDHDSDTLTGGEGDDELHGGAGGADPGPEDEVDRLTGGPGDDELHGDWGADTLSGDDGDDVLLGNSDNAIGEQYEGGDLIHGGAGADRIDGASGDDVLDGDAGDDFILGGPGVDALSGGEDRDLLDALDAAADATIDCGAGEDQAARHDRELDPAPIGCEGDGPAPPAPEPEPGAATGAPPQGEQPVLGPTVDGPLEPTFINTGPPRGTVFPDGTVTVNPTVLACPGAGAPCTVTTAVELMRRGIAVPLAVTSRAKRLRLGGSRFTIRAGSRKPVKFKLTRKAMKLLRSKRSLKVTVKVTVRRAGAPKTTRTFRLKLKAPRRR